MAGGSFVSIGDERLQLDHACPDELLAKAQMLRDVLSKNPFVVDVCFAPMSPIYAAPAAKISGFEPEFLHNFYLRPDATTAVRLSGSSETIPAAEGNMTRTVYEFPEIPGCASDRSLQGLVQELGDVSLCEYLKTKKTAVLLHALKAWKELLEEDESHQKMAHLDDGSIVPIRVHTVLAVGPSALVAAMGLVALGKKLKKQRYVKFVEQLLSSDPHSFTCYDINFDARGATYARLIPLPVEEPAT